MNGNPVKRGKISGLKAEAQQSQIFELPAALPSLQTGDHLSIVFEFCLRSDTSWAKKGYLVAYEQHILANRKATRPRSIPLGALYNKEKSLLQLQGTNINFSDDGILSLKSGNAAVLLEGPSLNFWRAPTDNDGIKGWSGQNNKALGRWQKSGLAKPVQKHQLLNVTERTVISRTEAKFKAGKIVMESHYSVSTEGDLLVKHEFSISKGLPDLPSLSITPIGDIEASASHYSQEQLTSAFHTYDIKPEKRTFLCLDVGQRGLGGASCGPDTLPQYLIDQKHYVLEYRMKVHQRG